MIKEAEMTPEKSVKFISMMIAKTKSNYGKEGSYYYLLWGWLTLLATSFHFVLLKTQVTELDFLPWPILMTIGMILTIIHSIRNRNKEKKETYIAGFLKIFFSTGSLLFIVGVFLCVKNELSPTPFVMLYSGVYGIVAGLVLQFKPLIAGGVLFILLSIVANFVEMDWQLIILFISILTGYLIPGYLLLPKKDVATT
jgi:hypothetical protein